MVARKSHSNIKGAIIGILLSINAFFVVRLVEKIDATETQVYALREDVASLKTRIDDLLRAGMIDSKSRHGRNLNTPSREL